MKTCANNQKVCPAVGKTQGFRADQIVSMQQMLHRIFNKVLHGWIGQVILVCHTNWCGGCEFLGLSLRKELSRLPFQIFISYGFWSCIFLRSNVEPKKCLCSVQYLNLSLVFYGLVLYGGLVFYMGRVYYRGSVFYGVQVLNGCYFHLCKSRL